jgi:hypothetical protein
MILLNPQDTDAVKFTALMYQDYISRQCATTGMRTIRGACRLRALASVAPNSATVVPAY